MDADEMLTTLKAPDATTKVPTLLDSGKMDANAMLGFYGTPLTVALREANLPLARILLEHGADPWAANVDEPPLVRAAQYCGPDAIDVLLAQPVGAGGDAEVAALRDRALYAASRWPQTPIIECLLKHGANPNSMPYAEEGFDPKAPPKPQDPNAPRPTINAHLNYAEQSEWGSGTPLHFAARSTPGRPSLLSKLRGEKSQVDDQVDSIKAMIRSGADLSLRDEMGRTALEVAEVAKADKRVLQVLREAKEKNGKE